MIYHTGGKDANLIVFVRPDLTKDCKVSILTSSVVDRGLEPWSGLTKTIKFYHTGGKDANLIVFVRPDHGSNP
jgi:hypothetical protein